MTRNEMAQARTLAQEPTFDTSNVDDSILYGCGLPGFQPVHVTLPVVAKFLRWQCCLLNGGWDAEAYDECCNILRRKAMLA